MSKEEYAELWYLLGKLKYAIGEFTLDKPSIQKEFQEVTDSIDVITKICIIDKDDKKTSIN